jgi:DNA-binding response OmpR family regulator
MSSTPAERPLVLVVDDDMTMRLLARETLEQAGFRVEEAEDGEAAVAAFAALRPDVILLDMMMPVLDGFEACAAVRKLEGGADVPVLIMTGAGDAESIRRVYEAGATDFIIKPVTWDLLTHRVNFVLRSNREFLQRSGDHLTR